MILWDYCAERKALINNLTATNLFQLEGSNANATILGDSGDISNLCQYEWFEWCKYRDSSDFPRQEMKLGRVLGPAKNHSNQMSQWILKDTMQIVPRRTSRSLTDEEERDPLLQREMENFMEKVRWRYGDRLKISKEAKASAKIETVHRRRRQLSRLGPL